MPETDGERITRNETKTDRLDKDFVMIIQKIDGLPAMLGKMITQKFTEHAMQHDYLVNKNGKLEKEIDAIKDKQTDYDLLLERIKSYWKMMLVIFAFAGWFLQKVFEKFFAI